MKLISAGRKVLVIFALMCAASGLHAQPRDSADDPALAPAVALLFHGPYSERSYKLSSAADGAVALEEVDGGRIRFVVRRVPGRRCVFLATHGGPDNLNIEQLDFTKFDGTYQFWEACGPKGTGLEKDCTYSLHFNSQQGYCQSIFHGQQIDLGNVPFPDDTCRPFGIGGRGREFYTKYIDAFKFISKQCGGPPQ